MKTTKHKFAWLVDGLPEEYDTSTIQLSLDLEYRRIKPYDALTHAFSLGIKQSQAIELLGQLRLTCTLLEKLSLVFDKKSGNFVDIQNTLTHNYNLINEVKQ